MIRDNTTERGYRGYCIDLMDTIAALCDFDYTILVTDQQGKMNENGEWNGVVRKLIDKEADIGMGMMHVTIDRTRVVDFTVPYYDMVGYTVLMLNTHPKTTFFKFATVLELNVWCCIFGAFGLTRFVFFYQNHFRCNRNTLENNYKKLMISVSSLLYCFDRWSPYSFRNNGEEYEDDPEKKIFTVKESLWFCITSFTPQV